MEKKISDGLAAANTALTYKGTISTYSDLSSKTNVEIGDVWMLSAKSGTYEIGDLFIATVKNGGTHTGGVIATGSVEWTYVPSGDELNTDTLFYGDVTITPGTDGSNGGSVTYELKASLGADDGGTPPAVPTNNENLTIEGGTDILINGSGSSAIVNHKTYGNVTPSSNGSSTTSITAVESLTLTNGHVTAIKTKTLTPKTYSLAGASDQITLTDSDGGKCGTITTSGDDWIDVDVTGNKVTVSHKDAVTTTGKTNTTSVTNGTLTQNGTLNIISGITYDSKGHISNVATKALTLPKDTDTTYDMFVGSASTSSAAYTSTTASANPYLILRNSNGANDSVQIKGDSGSLAVEAKSSGIQVSMVWGTF